MIYLDDACGASVVGERDTLLPDPLGGAWDEAAATLAPRPPATASRADVHLAILTATFVEAGWQIATAKVQRGEHIDCLGLHVVAASPEHPRGAIVCPEAKRLGLLAEIAKQAQATAPVCFRKVERLVGRLGHIAQIAPAANHYMQPLYRLQKVRLAPRNPPGTQPTTALERAAACRAAKRRVGAVWLTGEGDAAQGYQRCLSWWHQALTRGICVPLAVAAGFPALGAPGCAAIFTDAAREHGAGGGAWMALEDQTGGILFLHSAIAWPEDIARALRADALSMPAGELATLAVLVPVFRAAAECRGLLLTHLYCYTDSDATRAAINHDGSASPQLNLLAADLAATLDAERVAPTLQLLAVHLAGARNDVADALSRGRQRAVLRDLRLYAEGTVTTVDIPFPLRGLDLMRRAAITPHRHA